MAQLLGIVGGGVVGRATPVSLNPLIEPDPVGGLVLFAAFIVVTPLLGYVEMERFWMRSRFSKQLAALQRSPQVGFGAIAPLSFGLAIGLALGWSAPKWLP